MARKKTKTKKDTDPRWTSELRPAPGELRIVQAFVNTAVPAHGPELTSPRKLADWLVHWSLAPKGTPIGNGELERAVEAREALRTVLTVHRRGGTMNAAATEKLDQLAGPAALRVRFDASGQVRLEARPEGLDGALARLFAAIAAAQIEGTWPHLKTCARKECRAAFFDFSSNQSAKWCSANCGSRLSSRVYRRKNLERLRKAERGYARVRRGGEWFERVARAADPLGEKRPRPEGSGSSGTKVS